MTYAAAIKAQCPCGEARIRIDHMPQLRFLCHCTICQQVYDRDFSDVTVMLAKHVHVSDDANISFGQYKPPPALDRGTCTSCNHPVVGFLKTPGMPRLAFIPAAVLPESPHLPPPQRHIHYGTRVKDVADSLPKTESEMMSNLVLMPSILRVVFAG
jgi:hypothetical protein